MCSVSLWSNGFVMVITIGELRIIISDYNSFLYLYIPLSSWLNYKDHPIKLVSHTPSLWVLSTIIFVHLQGFCYNYNLFYSGLIMLFPLKCYFEKSYLSQYVKYWNKKLWSCYLCNFFFSPHVTIFFVFHFNLLMNMMSLYGIVIPF